MFLPTERAKWEKRGGRSPDKRISALILVVVVVVVGVFLSGCGVKQSEAILNISAASSLTDSLEEMKERYLEKNPGQTINLNFAASSVLKTQIEQGAEVDLFLSANFSHYDDLAQAELVKEGRQFAENSLVLAVADSNNTIQRVEDMQKEGTKVIFANDAVPIGKYAAEVLEKYDSKLGGGFAAQVQKNVVSREENVRQMLAKVVLGEGDCALVYDTDITADVADKVRILPIDTDCNVKGAYWAGVLSPKAKPFYEFLGSDPAKSILIKYGFLPR